VPERDLNLQPQIIAYNVTRRQLFLSKKMDSGQVFLSYVQLIELDTFYRLKIHQLERQGREWNVGVHALTRISHQADMLNWEMIGIQYS
jgi:hypothetical protein